MKLQASWSSTKTFEPSPDLDQIRLGWLTDEPPGTPDRPVLVTRDQRRVSPEDAGEINLFLERGLTAANRRLIERGKVVGYTLVPRDDRQMPAPKINMRLQIAPGTEDE